MGDGQSKTGGIFPAPPVLPSPDFEILNVGNGLFKFAVSIYAAGVLRDVLRNNPECGRIYP